MLAALYGDAPLAFWMVVAGLFVAVDLAIGTGFLVWVGFSALLMGAFSLTRWHLGVLGDLVAFGVVTALSLRLAAGGGGLHGGLDALKQSVSRFKPRDERRDAEPQDELARLAEASMRRDPDAALSRSRIIGRIARTTCPFVDGVGRVWIDGLEWTAQIDPGETLGEDAAVRVMGMVDEDRLQVIGLAV